LTSPSAICFFAAPATISPDLLLAGSSRSFSSRAERALREHVAWHRVDAPGVDDLGAESSFAAEATARLV